MVETQLDVINKLGLHARAAAKLVALSADYPCKILLRHNSREVNAKSIMGVMMLAASKGHSLTLVTDGQSEQEAADAIATLFAERFGEAE